MTDLLLLLGAAVGFGLGHLYASVKADSAGHTARVADQATWAYSATRWAELAKKAEARLARVEELCCQRCEMEPGECRCWFCRVRVAARGGEQCDCRNAETRPTPVEG